MLPGGGELPGLNVNPLRAGRYIRQYLGQEPEPNMPRHAEARWRLGRALEKGAEGRGNCRMPGGVEDECEFAGETGFG